MTSLVNFINDIDYVTNERTCVIFGCGRGGTSALAGGLRELGFAMPLAHPLKHEWSPVTDLDPSSLDNLKNEILNLNGLYSKWGWKSPKDVFVALDILPLLRNPIVLIVVRNQLDVALSMGKYDGIDVEVAFDEALKAYNGVATFICNTYHPCAIISYENLLLNPNDIFQRINENYSLGCTSDEIERSISFIRQSKGYSTIESEQRDLQFSTIEQLTDRKNAQNRVYPPLISNLAQAIVLLERDIQVARVNLTHHIDELFRLTRERNKDLSLSIDESVLYQLYRVSRLEFKEIMFINSVVLSETVNMALSEHQNNNFIEKNNIKYNNINGVEENLSRKIYHLTRDKYLTFRKERQSIQYEIEEVIFRQKLLNCFRQEA